MMANKQLQSIKFPGLSDTYTTPQVDATLTTTGAAADAKKVGDEITSVKEDLSEIVPGLSDEAKEALLACFAHVAWIDEHGQDYYDALEEALSAKGEKTLVSISATFNQGQAVIYTDDDLSVLHQYLTVTATYDDSSSKTVSTYILSGTLNAGTSTVTVAYGNKTTTFTATITQRIYTFGWNAIAQKALTKVNGGPAVADRWNHMNLNESPTMLSARRAFVVDSGDSPYTVYADGIDTEYYPIPIPQKANRVTISITPAERYIIGSFALLNEQKTAYANVETIDPYAGSKTIYFSAGTRSHLCIGTKYAASGTPEYTEEPTSFSVIFEEV